MNSYLNQCTKYASLFVLFFLTFGLYAQQAENEFTLDAKLLSRGELRVGGFVADNQDSERMANFLLGQYRLSFDYKRSSWLQLRVSPQQSGVWGQATNSLSLFEAWALMKSESGFFAKIGRQGLEYDDERILGYDDWTMLAPSHDVLKFGYEGKGHKLHLILSYNQNPENMSTGTTFYSGGNQPHKSMQTLWYHYDTPKSLFGASLLFMNVGMQNNDQTNPMVYYQQLVGTYMKLKPEHWSLEGAFYYQMGKEEHGIPLDAFMGSVKAKFNPNDSYTLYAGYDYLSGDKYFAVPPHGGLGLVFHDKLRGFNAIYGTHHDFYGAMDFFYLDSYIGGFTPGLQNLFAGCSVNPTKALTVNATYHYFAIATNLEKMDKPLGHEAELSAAYTFPKAVKLSAGYTYMRGTETMVKLQQMSKKRHLHWGWLMLTVSPSVFHTTWQDKN